MNTLSRRTIALVLVSCLVTDLSGIPPNGTFFPIAPVRPARHQSTFDDQTIVPALGAAFTAPRAMAYHIRRLGGRLAREGPLPLSVSLGITAILTVSSVSIALIFGNPSLAAIYGILGLLITSYIRTMPPGTGRRVHE